MTKHRYFNNNTGPIKENEIKALQKALEICDVEKNMDILIFLIHTKNIKEYIGDIDTFLSEKDLENFKQLESSQKEQKNIKQDKLEERSSYLQKKFNKKKVKKLKNRISSLERQIEILDKSQKSIDLDLSDPEKFKELSQQKDFFEIYEKNQKKLQELESEWEEAVQKLEFNEANSII